VLPEAGLPAPVALAAAIVCAALGAAAAFRFALVGKPIVGLLGLAILVGGWIYSAPPLRLAARGLGEIDAALVVAALVPAVGYAAFAGAPDGRFLLVLVPCVCALLAMMLCVEIPDAAFDRACGKRNLVVRWGPAVAYARLPILVVLTLVSLAQMTLGRGLPPLAQLPVLPALAVGSLLAWRVWRGERRPATIAFLGVALYGATASGLAAAYALAAR
jgi:1,4-dihydroxy-2-naphthoate octaprenyltransferase